MAWVVHKFGGTSVADADCFRRVAQLVAARAGDNLAVVVSAMRGVTDQLLGLVERAAQGVALGAEIEELRTRYLGTVIELLPAPSAAVLREQFEKDIESIESVLKALSLVRSASHRSRDLVSGFGEIWSARLLTALLQSMASVRVPVQFVNARDILIIDSGEMGPIVV
jgi:aspartokinase/homoserine dehydrogenase 1